tara:strand:- start:2443 stop:4050 length:1608 start_codon:yes stop_codon:yes gene_type:complete
MVVKKRLLFILGILLACVLTTCDKAPSDPNDIDPPPPKVPTSVSVVEPSAAETYWTDRSVPCLHDKPSYTDKTTWLVNGEAAECTDGKLDTELADGEHEITARITNGGESVAASVTITIKDGFTVELIAPEDGTKLFAESEISCEATVTPEKYSEHLSVTVDGVGEDCTEGSVTLPEAGQTGITASVSIDGREEKSVVTLNVLPRVVVRVYPLTASGVEAFAPTGVRISITSGKSAGALPEATTADPPVSNQEPGGVHDFSRLLPTDVYESERVILTASAGDDFYEAQAEVTGPELLKIVEADSLGFVLAPKIWLIQCGPLAGQPTAIKLPEAFTRFDPNDRGSSFYKLRNISGDYKYLSTRSDQRPLPVAFNRDKSTVPITASDSTTFWQATDDVLEPRLCRGDLFTPATMADVPNTSHGIHVWADNSSFAGSGFGNDEVIQGGFIGLEISHFGNWVQRHEQGHSLGFGHTSEWAGIMSIGSFPGGFDLEKYSVVDVAHIQLYLDTFDLQYEERVSFGVYAWRRMFDIPSLPDN